MTGSPLTPRERVQAALSFERPDRLPVNESPWEQTLARWRAEGLPSGVSPADFFGFDIAVMYIDASPRFPMRVLERREGSITYEDRYGYTIRKPEGISSTMRFLEHRTVDERAWDEIKSRFVLRPDAPARIDDSMYFGHFDPYPTWAEAKRRYDGLRATERYLLFMVYGPWEATWRHRGMESLLMDLVTGPEWVRDMADTFQGLVIEILARCVALGMRPDGLLVADDLGSTFGPLMAPAMWGRIFAPCYRRLAWFLRGNGIKFFLHCDGAIEPLLDGFIDAGVEVLNPLEVKAGLDVVALRRRYGKRLCFYGNIEARKMAGPRDVLLRELEHKIPGARAGGYIMHSDHSCPPDVSLERYRWMLETARAIFAGDPGTSGGGRRAAESGHEE